MTDKHTPIKLKTGWYGDEPEVRTDDEFSFASLCASATMADARRLAASWNACASLSTEALEAGVVKALLAACKEAEELIAKNTYPQPDKPNSQWGKLQRIRAAIALAEGRQ